MIGEQSLTEDSAPGVAGQGKFIILRECNELTVFAKTEIWLF